MPEASPTGGSGASRGFVFAASGAGYTPVAAAAAASLREMCPGAQIDLFTDTPPAGAHPFDRIHPLEHKTHRPKFEAMLRSRFDLTVYLDNDMIFLADITDIFDVLERHDIAAAHFETRASKLANQVRSFAVPAAFPQINGGLMGIRRSPATTELLERVQKILLDEGGMDQPPLREALFLSDLRLAILPVEYNMMRLWVLNSWRRSQGAPRVLHLRKLQRHLRDAEEAQRAFNLRRLVHPVVRARIQALLDDDRSLEGKRKRTVSTGPLKHILRRLGLI
ncbi:putative nucleotide-diphospho-sugar transferase [Mangrovicoccus ximenensis]|uniref:putative nucleotide-diphospho-sugar transferase n=1 Tax=Mangrovicoccus ximenensis TaxID=1911570 RepID=UPI000D359858|nr:putative nucleotide-diphospho-sugar transferase [Mangrovicoccus ximenensis]